MPAHVPARTRPFRCQEGLRRGRLRRLHRANRRRAGAQLSDPGLPRRRSRRDDDRRPCAGWWHPSDATGVSGCTGLSMRLLHIRHDPDLRIAEPGAAAGPRRRAERQYLPLHRLPLDRGCAERQDQHRRRPRGHRIRPQRPCPRGTAGGARHGALHVRCCAGRYAAHQDAAFAASARKNHLDRQACVAQRLRRAHGTDV